jgi:hypothetical protein
LFGAPGCIAENQRLVAAVAHVRDIQKQVVRNSRWMVKCRLHAQDMR